MWRPHRLIRPDERRDAIAAFLVLFGFVASHTLLETARDALFLAEIPATRLPWTILLVATASVAASAAQQRLAGRLGSRVALATWTAVAAIVTFAFWLLVPRLGAAGLHALYVWSGVLGVLVLAHFWSLLGTIFSITQAKRLYGLIGAGSVLGALVGSGAASLLARAFSPRALVLVAAAGFVVTALAPLCFSRQVAPTPLAPPRPDGLVGAARFVLRDGYARRIAWLVVLAAACTTVADVLFKTIVAAEVPAAELGAFLGSVAFAMNVASLLAQVVLVPVLVRRVGVGATLAVMPILLVISGAGIVVLGTLGAALALRAVDGSLRHSLHRTGLELVFLPLDDEARRRTRTFADVVGHRGGQVAASAGMLALAAAGAPLEAVAAALIAMAAAWGAWSLALRSHYVALFRGRLGGRRARAGGELHLDVTSLETLVRALGSENDNEVLAALDVLDREDKPDLVPALILYHPSDAVLERALEMLTRARRRGVVAIIDRLAEHPSPRARAALLAARSVLDDDQTPLRARLAVEEAPEVRAAIIVNLVASSAIVGDDAREEVASILREGTAAIRIALADAIGRRGATSFVDVVVALAGSDDPEVRVAALRALGRVAPGAHLPLVVAALGDERARREAQRILVEAGVAGFDALVRAIDDRALPTIGRVRIPHTLAQLDAAAAAPILLGWLGREREGAVRHQILRALVEITRREPTVVLDRALLDATIAATIAVAYRNLDRRLILARGAAAAPERRTPGHEALVQLLADEESNAIRRLFDLLGLAHRSDDFRQIHRGLRSGRKEARAASMELVENALREPVRGAVLGLVDDVPDGDRLAAAARHRAPLGLDYDGVLAEMLAGGSESIRDLTDFHVGEIRLADGAGVVVELPGGLGPGVVSGARVVVAAPRAS